MENSKESLVRKLGIKPDVRLFTLHAPDGYLKDLAELTTSSKVTEISDGSSWIQAFYTDSRLLENEISQLKNILSKDGQLWLSWPKKSSGVTSDLSDSEVRRIGLASGLVDVKVAAIDDTWSALKFIYRLSDQADSA